VHPAMLYETILYTGVFFLLWRLRGKGLAHGRMACIYLALAGVSRFVVEFVRINPRVWWMFSEAQLIAVGMMVLGGVGLLLLTQREEAPQASQHAAAGV